MKGEIGLNNYWEEERVGKEEREGSREVDDGGGGGGWLRRVERTSVACRP